jgi:hypothetical protein
MAVKADETAAPAKGSGWLKTFLGGLAGLLSGAVVMYLSPLLDRVVKPVKPVANFAVDQQDLTVTFHNRSVGGSQGWWDFGDGSPLEPMDPQRDIITHTYIHPGTYTAKLMLRNLISEESERTVSVQLDRKQQGIKPQIVTLEVDPVSPGSYAPATFRVVSKTRNADLVIWSLSDDRPLEINADGTDLHERLVTFPKPGGYLVKLAAIGCRQAVERSEIIYVNEPPEGSVAVILHVSDQATRVESLETTVPVSLAFPPDSKGDVYPVDQRVPSRQGFEILEARLQPVSDPAARNVRVQVAPDRRSVQLLGELVREPRRPLNRKPAAPTVLARVQLIQERRSPVSRPPESVTSTLSVPGSALLSLPSLPSDWADPQRLLRLELREGDRVVWQESQLPRGVPVQFQNRRCTLTAVPLGNQVRIDLAASKPGQQVTSK